MSEIKNEVSKTNATNQVVEYTGLTGDKIELSPSVVKGALTKNNEYITDDDVFMFMEVCKFQKLNPFIGEAYLVKYDKDASKPAQMVVSKEALLKRAELQETYDGLEEGIVVEDSQGNFHDL